MEIGIGLTLIIIVGILAAAYPISHTFEHLEGNSPPPDIQKRNEENENTSLLVLLACLIIGGLFIFGMTSW